MQKYEQTLKNNIQSQQRTLREKQKIILQQDFFKAIPISFITRPCKGKDSRYIYINHLEEIVSLENNFKFLEQDNFAQKS